MPITNPIVPNISAKDVVILQRSNDNQSYGEIHISGSKLIFYLDSNGYLNADVSSSFYSLFPPPDSGGLIPGNLYQITSSWAENSIWSSQSLSASWAPSLPSDISISSSWASASISASLSLISINSSWASSSLSSSISTTASFSIISNISFTASYWDSGSLIDWILNYFQSKIITGSLLPITSSWSISASWAPGGNSDISVSSSWASSSVSSSQAITASYANYAGTAIISNMAISSSWASSSLSASYWDSSSLILWTNNNFQSKIITGSLLPITSSRSVTSSYALNTPPISHVIKIQHANGTITNIPDGGSDEINGNNLRSAINNAISGDAIYIYGDFDTHTGEIHMPNNVSLIGSGMYLTTIYSSNQNTILDPGSNCYISNLTIKSTNDNDYSFPVRSNYTRTNVIFENVYVEGYTDALFLEDLSGTGSLFNFINCRFSSRWDHLVFGCPTGSAIFHNCEFKGILDDTGHGWVNQGINSSNGLVKLYNCSLNITGGVGVYATYTPVSVGQVEIYGGKITSNGGTDLLCDGSPSQIAVTVDTVYDVQKTSGPITYLNPTHIRYQLNNTIDTASYLNGTASYSLFSVSASWAPGSTSDISISASWASQSLSSSWSNYTLSSSWSNYTLSSSWAASSLTASYISGPIAFSHDIYSLTSSWAVSASYALNSSVITGTLLPITSSQSITASYALISNIANNSIISNTASFAETIAIFNQNNDNCILTFVTQGLSDGAPAQLGTNISISCNPIAGNITAVSFTGNLYGNANTSNSSSWASSSLSSSYLDGTSSYAILARSASWAPGSTSDISVSASWASQSLSSSWAPAPDLSAYALKTNPTFFGTINYEDGNSDTFSIYGDLNNRLVFSNPGWIVTLGEDGLDLRSGPNTDIPLIGTSSWAENAISYSYAYFITASQSDFATSSLSASYAVTASYAMNGGGVVSSAEVALYASSSLEADIALLAYSAISTSYSQTSSWATYAINAGTNIYSGSYWNITSSISDTSSFSLSSSAVYSVFVSSSPAINSIYYIPFVTSSDISSFQTLYTDSCSCFMYNPYTDILFVPSITASRVTASLFGTASGAISSSYSLSASYSVSSSRTITSSFSLLSTSSSFSTTSSYAGTSSWAVSTVIPGIVILSGSYWNITSSISDRSITSSFSITSSYSNTSSLSDKSFQSVFCETTDFSLDSMFSVSSSYAETASYISSGVSSESASYADTASYVIWGRTMGLCLAFTPTSLGPDEGQIPSPYSPIDGISPISWNVKRITLRTSTPESTLSSVDIEKSSVPGSFSAIHIGSVELTSGSYEAYSLASSSITSGDKIRFNVTNLGTSTNWTLVMEISNV